MSKAAYAGTVVGVAVVGISVVGSRVGDNDGIGVVGSAVCVSVGLCEGISVGATEGSCD